MFLYWRPGNYRQGILICNAGVWEAVFVHKKQSTFYLQTNSLLLSIKIIYSITEKKPPCPPLVQWCQNISKDRRSKKGRGEENDQTGSRETQSKREIGGYIFFKPLLQTFPRDIHPFQKSLHRLPDLIPLTLLPAPPTQHCTGLHFNVVDKPLPVKPITHTEKDFDKGKVGGTDEFEIMPSGCVSV